MALRSYRVLTKARSDNISYSSQDDIVKALNKHLEELDDNRIEVQKKIHDTYEKIRSEISELKDGINSALERLFTKEDNDLQSTVSSLQAVIASEEEKRNSESVDSAVKKAKAELVVKHVYRIKKRKNDKNESGLLDTIELVTENEVDFDFLEHKKPEKVQVKKVELGKVYFCVTFFNPEEEKVVVRSGLGGVITYKALLQKKGKEGGKECILRREEDGSFSFVAEALEAEATYTARMKVEIQGKESEWSEEIEFIPMFPEFCAWKECPDYVNWRKEYSVDEENSRIAAKINSDSLLCTVYREHSPSKKQSDFMEHKNTEIKKRWIWHLHWSCTF